MLNSHNEFKYGWPVLTRRLIADEYESDLPKQAINIHSNIVRVTKGGYILKANPMVDCNGCVKTNVMKENCMEKIV